MASFAVDSWVWKEDLDQFYVPAIVEGSSFVAGNRGRVKTEDGKVHELDVNKTRNLESLNPEILDPELGDLIHLQDLSEQAILHNLRIRFKRDVIYTKISSILVSVNPFKILPLYTPEVLDQFTSRETQNQAPHIFSIGQSAYQSMLGDGRNQSIIISGESGAGKTEIAKLILQYLAEVSQIKTTTAVEVLGGTELEQQILQANPMMEAFGNAKTVYNDNSSRFGKLITIKFDKTGSITGGAIVNYLLEKSRVVKHSEGECNYHIFYQLLEAAVSKSSLVGDVSLLHADEYFYLKTRSQTDADVGEMLSEKKFEELVNAMDILHISLLDQSCIYKLLSAILFCGNVEFEPDFKQTEEDGSKVTVAEPLETSASLLEVDVHFLTQALTSVSIGTRSVIYIPYNVDQACGARDAMCKHVYSRLFDWLIGKINATLDVGSTEEVNCLNVLDIFGFECFNLNSFEQLCINYCNEKLQFHFNDHVFRLEQEEYKSEGIAVTHTEFKDNSICVSLFETARVGILAMMDEEVKLSQGSDVGFMEKVMRENSGHPALKPTSRKHADYDSAFVVKHFAGDVMYHVTGFLEKTKDSLAEDIAAVLESSSMRLLREIVTQDTESKPKITRRGSTLGIKKPTLGAQFKRQLSLLYETLTATSPHFIRCLKPNVEKRGNVFDSIRILHQLRNTGLLQVCQIRQTGFPVRIELTKFAKHYSVVLKHSCASSSNVVKHASLEDLLRVFAEDGTLISGSWARGARKMFLKSDQHHALELCRQNAIAWFATKIQAAVRSVTLRARYSAMMQVLSDLKGAISARDEVRLESVLEACRKFHLYDSRLPEVLQARNLLPRLQEERHVTALLTEAITGCNIQRIRAALAVAAQLSPPFESPQVLAAQELALKLEAEEIMKRRLQGAIQQSQASRDCEFLQQEISHAMAMSLNCQELQDAQVLLDRLLVEVKVCLILEQAIVSKRLKGLSRALAKMSELGLTEHPQFKVGDDMRQRLTEQLQAKTLLGIACHAQDAEPLQEAMDRALKLGLPRDAPEYVEAENLMATLQQRAKEHQIQVSVHEQRKRQLVVATKSKDLEALRTAIQEAAASGVDSGAAEIQSARAVLTQLEEDEQVCADLRSGMQSGKAEILEKALVCARERGLWNQDVEQAIITQKRIQQVEHNLQALQVAVAQCNLTELQEQLKVSVQLGVEPGVLVAAKKLSSTLQEIKASSVDLLAGVSDIQHRSKLSSGLAARDVDEFGACVERMCRLVDENQGLNIKFDVDIAFAQGLLEACRTQLVLQETLGSALRSGDHAELKAAVDATMCMELRSLDVWVQAKKKLLELQGTEGRVIRQRQQWVKEGSSSRYHFGNYPKLRSSEDDLKWQRTVLHRSITQLETQDSTLATSCHQCMLGYMGDKLMNFPSTLVSSILQIVTLN